MTDVIAFDGDEEGLLSLAAAVESRAGHPLARAIVAHARERGIDPPPAEGTRMLPGLGALSLVGGEEAWAGSPAMAARRGGSIPHPDVLDELERNGRTVVVCGIGAEARGAIALRDEPRPDAAATVEALRELGVREIVMLTGDNEGTARAIAREIGIEEVRSGLGPEQKVREIERLGERHGRVAMVGDGINDAPALATADLGIAVGAGGADAAIEAADVALLADDLTKVPEAFRLGARAGRIARQNLVFSIAVLALLVPGAVAGMLTVVAAVLVHEASELLAVGNGLRASRPPSPRKPRKLGLWTGRVEVGEDFDAPLPWEIRRHFEGGED